MTTSVRNPIAALLGIDAPRDTLAFSFEGRRFELYPAVEKQDGTLYTCETLYTYWADGSRDVAAIPGQKDLDIRLAVVLMHKFRRGMNRADARVVLDRARASLATVDA